jgi:CDP-paratose 2-epimerase
VYSALAGRPVTVYGDGLQVRDVLHVADFVSAVNAARAYAPVLTGKAFNIGGGISRSISVNEMIALVEKICHKQVHCGREPARPGDQLFYVSDNARFANQTGWMPRRSLEPTVRDISAFWHANRMYVMRPQSVRKRSIERAA